MGELISAIMNAIMMIVDGVTKNAVAQAVWKREGEIQNAVINYTQERYSTLEDNISATALTQYEQQLNEETKAKVMRGNLTSIGIVIVVLFLLTLLWYVFNNKKP